LGIQDIELLPDEEKLRKAGFVQKTFQILNAGADERPPQSRLQF
jgi:hypothetical protein